MDSIVINNSRNGLASTVTHSVALKFNVAFQRPSGLVETSSMVIREIKLEKNDKKFDLY